VALPTEERRAGEMRGIKFFVAMVFAILFSGMTYLGLVSRQSAQAGTSGVHNRASALEREMAETSRAVNGPRR
jgi:hypothetical protein